MAFIEPFLSTLNKWFIDYRSKREWPFIDIRRSLSLWSVYNFVYSTRISINKFFKQVYREAGKKKKKKKKKTILSSNFSTSTPTSNHESWCCICMLLYSK